MNTKPHPIQPLQLDEKGVLRFKPNAIVRYLLDHGGIDMNHLALRNFTVEDQEQFAQLIGYSLSGFGELSYVRDETYNSADRMSKTDETEQQAKLAAMEETISDMRKQAKIAHAALEEIHGLVEI